MPLYDCKCSRSGKVFERFIKLTHFEEPITCACNALANRVISTPMFTVDTTDYNCPVTDKHIGSKHEHRDNLARQGCRVLEPGEAEKAKRYRDDANADLDRRVEATVEREIESWSSAKKERLSNELINGKADLAVERR